MSTVELKLSLHQLIDGVSDNSVLEAVYTLLSKATANQQEDWYHSLSDEDKAAIELGIQQADRGESTPHKQVMLEVDKLLGRA
jgi:hypothetical protein